MALLAATTIKADPTGLIVTLIPDVNTQPTDGGHTRSPLDVPVFYLDGHTLTASSHTVGSTVELKDETGTVAFSTYVYIEGDINLPSYLCGTYTIEVTRGGITFYGEIELE